MRAQLKKMNIDFDKLFDAVIVGADWQCYLCAPVLCGFLSGGQILEESLEILNIHSGGLAIYGGIIGALVFGALWRRSES